MVARSATGRGIKGGTRETERDTSMDEPKIINTKTFSCDDDHPIVWYTFDKDAFCGPGIVHIKDGEVIALYNEVPEGAKLVKKDIDAAAFERWSLRAKAKWD